MKGIVPETPVYLWLGVTDMRAGFERLSAVVQKRMSRSVTSGGLYVFFSRCRRRIKILYWDNDGYALWYKRLEAGTFRVHKSREQPVIRNLRKLESQVQKMEARCDLEESCAAR